MCSFPLNQKSRIHQYANVFCFKSLTAEHKMAPASKRQFLVRVHWGFDISIPRAYVAYWAGTGFKTGCGVTQSCGMDTHSRGETQSGVFLLQQMNGKTALQGPSLPDFECSQNAPKERRRRRLDTGVSAADDAVSPEGLCASKRNFRTLLPTNMQDRRQKLYILSKYRGVI